MGCLMMTMAFLFLPSHFESNLRKLSLYLRLLCVAFGLLPGYRYPMSSTMGHPVAFVVYIAFCVFVSIRSPSLVCLFVRNRHNCVFCDGLRARCAPLSVVFFHFGTLAA